MDPQSHHISVHRTARYFTLGDIGPETREIWYVLHGYAQLAERFVKHFADLVAPGVAIVAPEALSRFYFDGMSGKVGASWMTKEDRLSEIEDYLAYLGDLEKKLSTLAPNIKRTVLLGFSQGTATAWRCLRKGVIPATDIITWTGSFPKELSLDWVAENTELGMHLALATRDEYIPFEKAKVRAAELKSKVPQLQVHIFEDTHRLHAETLAQITHLIRQRT